MVAFGSGTDGIKRRQRQKEVDVALVVALGDMIMGMMSSVWFCRVCGLNTLFSMHCVVPRIRIQLKCFSATLDSALHQSVDDELLVLLYPFISLGHSSHISHTSGWRGRMNAQLGSPFRNTSAWIGIKPWTSTTVSPSEADAQQPRHNYPTAEDGRLAEYGFCVLLQSRSSCSNAMNHNVIMASTGFLLSLWY